MSVHVHQFVRLIAEHAPEVRQEFALQSEDPMARPDLVCVHQGNELGREIVRWHEAGVPVVTRLFNSRWVHGQDADLRMHCVEKADLVLGWACPAPPDLAHLPYAPMYPLVPASVFRPLALTRDQPFFVPRITARDAANLYWTEELLACLPMCRTTYANGFLSPLTMSRCYNSAQVVVCTGLDPYLGNSAVEAALCGCVPVLSDTAANRAEFPTGARFCDQAPASILRACAEVTELARDAAAYEAEASRNRAHFSGWAVEVHGQLLVRQVLMTAGYDMACTANGRTAA